VEEPPGRAVAALGRIVEHTAKEIAREEARDEVGDHERRCHAIPPPDNSPISALPFANFKVDDDLLCHAIELLEDLDERSVAAQLGIPFPAFEQALAEYARRRGKFLQRRARIG
jgi:hypothetical protein